jgi:polysaccharide biosynthesis/export protein
MKIFRILFLILILSLNSCVSKKKVLYLQGEQVNSSNAVNYEPIIQNDDLLSIKILSSQTELSEPFNLSSMSSSIGNAQKGYLVDQNGEIEFPVLGKLKIAGFTKSELKQFFKDKLALYIANPIVDITILNYKISVLGEVHSPGIVEFTSDRITLLDAIASSGDLTTSGKRDNILIVRDFQGTKTFNRVDITKADFVNSPFYYLDQNDIVYVEARKAKIDSTGIIGSNVTTIISLVSALITTSILLSRL